MKYKLTENKKVSCGIALYQIEALKDFRDIEKGDKGGYVEKENNLSQDGNAWVFGNAKVSGNAEVFGDAWVSGNARVFGDARVFGRLKLLAGYFFGIRYQKEEIKYKEINEESELIYKGEAKFGEEEDKPKNEIIIDGIKYRKIN